jgi:pilus assembly protein CpaE
METSANILIVSELQQNTSQLKTIAESFSNQVTSVNYSDAIREMNRETRDIVIVSQSETEASVELVQSIRIVNPACLLLFVAKASDFTLLRNIIRSGADEFFVFPDETSLFTSRFPTIVKNYEIKKNSMEEAAVTYGRNRGQILSFYSGKGGSGRTLIASSVAQTLKLESTAEVILIDLNTQYGGIENVFSIESNRSLADLMPVVEELNESHIRNVAETQQDSKLEILISPCDAEVAELIGEEFIAKLIRTCRRSFDYVLIDLPSHMNAQVVTALEESDKIFYILSPDTSAMKTLKQFETLSTRLGIHLANRMEIVLNEIAKENEVQQTDLKNVLRFPIAASIRRDIKGLQPYINKGMPVRTIQKERKLILFAKDIRKFSRDLLKQ